MVCWVYSLELPWWGNATEYMYTEYSFSWWNKLVPLKGLWIFVFLSYQKTFVGIKTYLNQPSWSFTVLESFMVLKVDQGCVCVFSSPELCSGCVIVITFCLLSIRLWVCPSFNIFKRLLLWSHWANFAQYGASLGWGNKRMLKWARYIDQDGCHAHIW